MVATPVRRIFFCNTSIGVETSVFGCQFWYWSKFVLTVLSKVGWFRSKRPFSNLKGLKCTIHPIFTPRSPIGSQWVNFLKLAMEWTWSKLYPTFFIFFQGRQLHRAWQWTSSKSLFVAMGVTSSCKQNNWIHLLKIWDVFNYFVNNWKFNFDVVCSRLQENLLDPFPPIVTKWTEGLAGVTHFRLPQQEQEVTLEEAKTILKEKQRRKMASRTPPQERQLLPPLPRVTSDHLAPKDWTLQTQALHVHQIPLWWLCSMPLRHISDDCGTPPTYKTVRHTRTYEQKPGLQTHRCRKNYSALWRVYNELWHLSRPPAYLSDWTRKKKNTLHSIPWLFPSLPHCAFQRLEAILCSWFDSWRYHAVIDVQGSSIIILKTDLTLSSQSALIAAFASNNSICIHFYQESHAAFRICLCWLPAHFIFHIWFQLL